MELVKAELETWGAALQAYDDQDFDKALATFEVRFPDAFRVDWTAC